MEVKLTEGAIEKLLSGGFSLSEGTKPLLQVTKIGTPKSKAPGDGDVDNYWICFSDGLFFGLLKLAPKCNHFVTSKQLKKSSVVRLTDFAYYTGSQGHMCVVIHDLEVLHERHTPIGTPKQYESKTGSVGPQLSRFSAAMWSSMNNPQPLGKRSLAGSVSNQNTTSNLAPEPKQPESKRRKVFGDRSSMTGLDYKTLIDHFHHYSVLAQTYMAHLAERYFWTNKALETEKARVKELQKKIDHEKQHLSWIEAQIVAERKDKEEQKKKLQADIAKAEEKLG